MRTALLALLTAALTTLPTANSAAACGSYGYYYHSYSYPYHHYSYSYPYRSYRAAPCRVYYAPIECCSPCYYDCCAEGVTYGSAGDVVEAVPHADAPSPRHEPTIAQPPSPPVETYTARPNAEEKPIPRWPSPPKRLRAPSPHATQELAPPPEEVAQPRPESPIESTPSVDDLFGPSEDASPSPVVQPTEEDDRYAPPAETPSEPAFDSLFGEPEDELPQEPAPTEESVEEPLYDDLFDDPAPIEESTSEAEEPMLEEEEPAEEADPETTEEDEDDLFGGFGAILKLRGGLASIELRHWVDISGQFSCDGRIVRLLDGRVQLLKANGRTATVPLDRLSRRDLDFVHRQASAHRAVVLGNRGRAASPLAALPAAELAP